MELLTCRAVVTNFSPWVPSPCSLTPIYIDSTVTILTGWVMTGLTKVKNVWQKKIHLETSWIHLAQKDTSGRLFRCIQRHLRCLKSVWRYSSVSKRFFWNPRCKGMERTCWAAQPIWPKSVLIRPNWLCSPVRPFHALKARILSKIFLESLNHAS